MYDDVNTLSKSDRGICWTENAIMVFVRLSYRKECRSESRTGCVTIRLLDRYRVIDSTKLSAISGKKSTTGFVRLRHSRGTEQRHRYSGH